MSAIQRPATNPERVLVVRLCNWIGDVILSLPTLERLAAEGYSLQLYGKGWAPSLLAAYPWPVTIRKGTLSERVRQLKALRPAVGPASALAMPNSFSSALELRLAGFSVAGYARDGRSLLLGQKLPRTQEPHAIQQFWQMGRHLNPGHGTWPAVPPNRIDFRVAPACQGRADDIVAAHNLTSGFVCLVPFATGTMRKQTKVWPHFKELAQRLASLGHRLIVCPGPGEEAICQADYPQVLRLDNIDLGTYAALLSRSRLVIANDTGPGHMAAAVGAPLLSLLGPTAPEEWGAWGPQVHRLGGHMTWPTLEEVEAEIALMMSSHAT
jgi:heptosyltransferase-2